MVKKPETLEELKTEQEREYQELIQKMSGKRYGKVSQSKIKALATKHVKQFVRTSKIVAHKEARRQFKEDHKQ
jgi:hypothetical protein